LKIASILLVGTPKSHVDNNLTSTAMSAVAARRAQHEAKLKPQSPQKNEDSRQSGSKMTGTALSTIASGASDHSQTVTVINETTLGQISPIGDSTGGGDLLMGLS
jgi:hypothetical protein